MSHYKQLGAKADAREVSVAEALKMHLSKCNEARTSRDWESVEEESHMAISSGADSSPQVSTSVYLIFTLKFVVAFMSFNVQDLPLFMFASVHKYLNNYGIPFKYY